MVRITRAYTVRSPKFLQDTFKNACFGGLKIQISGISGGSNITHTFISLAEMETWWSYLSIKPIEVKFCQRIMDLEATIVKYGKMSEFRAQVRI